MLELFHEEWEKRHQYREQIRQTLARKRRDPDVRIWGSLIGGSLIWALHLMTVYPLTSLTCRWGWFETPSSAPGLRLAQVLATLAAAGLVATLGWVAFGEWRRENESHDELSQAAAARRPALAFVALLINTLYLLIILIMLAPILLLPVCS